LLELGIDISDRHCKCMDEFVGRDFNYVNTVCDNAKESCPIFAGKTIRPHWSIEDPAAVQGSEEERLIAAASVAVLASVATRRISKLQSN